MKNNCIFLHIFLGFQIRISNFANQIQIISFISRFNSLVQILFYEFAAKSVGISSYIINQ